jgi:hypothetical protein
MRKKGINIMPKSNYAYMPPVWCAAMNEEEIRNCKFRRTHLFSDEDLESILPEGVLKKKNPEDLNYLCAVRGGTKERPTCNCSYANAEVIVSEFKKLEVGYAFGLLSQRIDLTNNKWCSG